MFDKTGNSLLIAGKIFDDDVDKTHEIILEEGERIVGYKSRKVNEPRD